MVELNKKRFRVPPFTISTFTAFSLLHFQIRIIVSLPRLSINVCYRAFLFVFRYDGEVK